MSTISVLNLDNSYPVADPNHASNNAGTIRFIGAADAQNLNSLNRLQGDIQHKFSLHQSKINEIILALAGNPASASFDDSAYIKADGSRAFAAPVTGVTPTASGHFSTKGYVDGFLATIQGVLDANTLAVQGLEERLPKAMSSPWTLHTWQPGQKQALSFTLSPAVYDLDDILSVSLLERLDVAQPTEADPTPDPVYVYRYLTAGIDVGFMVDDLWLDPNGVMKVLVPNSVFFASGHSEALYGPITSPQNRWLKAVALVGSPSAHLSSNITYKSGKVAVASGALTTSVSFTQPFLASPQRIEVNLLRPSSGAQVIAVSVDKSSISASGFTVGFSAELPSSGYDLQWSAFL